MEVNQEIINKFFQNKCTAAEVDVIVDYFKKNRNALDYYIGQDEWDAISYEGHLENGISHQVLENLKKELFNKKNGKIASIKKIYLKQIAAAASILIVSASVYWYISKEKIQNNTEVVKETNFQKSNTNSLEINTWKIRMNNSDSSMKIKLEDGSTVTLYKETIIKYQEPFAETKREIVLDGDAFFEVAKDKMKPFVVNTGSLSTTALGTSFRVTALNSGKEGVNVKLYTGKVVIKSINRITNWKGDVFLSPGEQLSYKNNNKDNLVSNFTDNGTKTIALSEISNEIQTLNEIKFHNTSLSKVFIDISKFYSVRIEFEEREFDKMNFTGLINKKDDVESILKIVSHMNQLEIAKINDGYKITRLPRKQ